MRDAAQRAIEIAQPLARIQLEAHQTETLALTRLVEVIGEAARRVPEAVRVEHAGIPWRQIIGTRDRLIHGYDQVDLDILWIIVRERLPSLVQQVDLALRDLEGS